MGAGVPVGVAVGGMVAVGITVEVGVAVAAGELDCVADTLGEPPAEADGAGAAMKVPQITVGA